MSKHSFSLPGNMTIGNITSCQAQLFSMLNTSDEICIDVGDVKQIDSSGVQLLLMLSIEAEKQNLNLKWLNHSPVLDETVRVLGFENSLSFD